MIRVICSHETISEATTGRWRDEMIGMKSILQDLSYIESNHIKGVRAPQLAVGGNSQFEMMQAAGFTYDNSMSVQPGKDSPPYWPQTLDYSVPWRCDIPNCPTKSFPAIWALPINQFYGYYVPEAQEHKRGAMVRAAMNINETPQSVKDLLISNFNRSYQTNRAPFVVTLNADFLTILPNAGSVSALEQFLTQVSLTILSAKMIN